MNATETTLVQATIDEQDHIILKTMALEKKTTIAHFIRAAVRVLVTTEHGKRIARRLRDRNG